MTRMAASKARDSFSDTLNRVAYGGERVVIHRRGKTLAAIVPAADLARLEELEDRADVKAGRKALADPKRVPYEQVRRKMRLS